MCSSTAAAPVESRPVGLGMLGLKDYEDYRRSLYGEITHKALLVDAAGTLLVPSQPMAQVCLCMCFCAPMGFLGLWVFVCMCWRSGFLSVFFVSGTVNWFTGFRVNVCMN